MISSNVLSKGAWWPHDLSTVVARVLKPLYVSFRVLSQMSSIRRLELAHCASPIVVLLWNNFTDNPFHIFAYSYFAAEALCLSWNHRPIDFSLHSSVRHSGLHGPSSLQWQKCQLTLLFSRQPDSNRELRNKLQDEWIKYEESKPTDPYLPPILDREAAG